jgi:hypothetical protein
MRKSKRCTTTITGSRRRGRDGEAQAGNDKKNTVHHGSVIHPSKAGLRDALPPTHPKIETKAVWKRRAGRPTIDSARQ